MGKNGSKLEVGTEALSWRPGPPPPWRDDDIDDQSSFSPASVSTIRSSRRLSLLLGPSVRRRRERQNTADGNGRVEHVAQVVCRPSASTNQPQAHTDVLDEETEKLLEDLLYAVCFLIPYKSRLSTLFHDGGNRTENDQNDSASQSMSPQEQPYDKGHQTNTLRRCLGVHSLPDMKVSEGTEPTSSCWWALTPKGVVAVSRQELLWEVRRTFRLSEEKMKIRICHITERKAPCLAVRVEVPCASNLRLKSSLLGVAGVRCCVEGSKSSFVSGLVDAVTNPVWNLDCLIDVTSVQEEELRIMVRQETDVAGAGKRLTNQLLRGIGKVAQTYTTAQSYTQSNLYNKKLMGMEEDEPPSFTANTTATLPPPAVEQKVVKLRDSKGLAASLLSVATTGRMVTSKDAKGGISSDVIGVVTLPLKELTELGTSGVFSLIKYVEDKAGKNKTERGTEGKVRTRKDSKGDLKSRGEVEVRLTMMCRESQITYPGGALRGLQILLEKILRLHFSRYSSERPRDSTGLPSSDQDQQQIQHSIKDTCLQQETPQKAWGGDLPASLQALVTMYACVCCARPCDISLAWWCVCTKMPAWDASGTAWSAEETTATPIRDTSNVEWIEKQFETVFNRSRSNFLCGSMMSVMNCSMTSLTSFSDRTGASEFSDTIPLRRSRRSAGEDSGVTLAENADRLFLTMKSNSGTTVAHSLRETVSGGSKTILDNSRISLNNSSKTTIENYVDTRLNSVDQSGMTYVDASFLGHLLQKVQRSLEDDLFTEQQLKELRSSTVAWRRRTRQQLCRITSVFPSKAGVMAANQLACICSIYKQLETHPKIRLLLEDDLTISEVITESAEDWWRGVTCGTHSTVGRPNAVLEEVLRVSLEALRFLNDAVLFYDPVFSEHLRQSYSEGVYEEVVGKVMENVSSLLMTLDLRKHSASPPAGSGTCRRRRKKNRRKPLRKRGRRADEDEEEVEDEEETDTERKENDNMCSFSIEDKSPAWRLYVTLGQLYSLGETLSTLDVRMTPISGFHALFVPWQEEWLKKLGLYMCDLLPYEISRDTFESVSSNENISASASDMEHNLLLLRNCWLRLKLPEGAPRTRLLLKVLREMSEVASLYSDLVCRTLDVWVTKNKEGHVTLTKEVCTGLNNIAYTRKSLSAHMQYLVATCNTDGSEEAVRRIPNPDQTPAPSGGAENTILSEEVQATESGMTPSPSQNVPLRITEGSSIFASPDPSPKSFQSSLSNGILNTSHTLSLAHSSTSHRARQLAQEVAQADTRMRKKEERYINAMVHKLRGNLRKAVTQSCLQSSGLPLQQELEPVQNLLLEELSDDEHNVLVKRRLWRILLDLFYDVIRSCTKHGQPEFYRAMHDVVQQFLPSDNESGAISSNDMTSIPEYQCLMQELKVLQRSTSNIIASYYRQRASDRLRVAEAVLDVRMGLTTSRRLRLQVAMLSSLRQFSAQSQHVGSQRTSQASSSSFSIVYIKIQLVPSGFFKDARSVNTRNLSWNKFVVFDESLYLQVTPRGVDQGLVLFSLVASRRRGSSVIVAEGVVPLDLVPILEESSTPPNYRIKLTRPGPVDDYESLRILQQRKDDTLARRFLSAQLHLRKKPLSFSFCPFCCCGCTVM